MYLPIVTHRRAPHPHVVRRVLMLMLRMSRSPAYSPPLYSLLYAYEHAHY